MSVDGAGTFADCGAPAPHLYHHHAAAVMSNLIGLVFFRRQVSDATTTAIAAICHYGSRMMMILAHGAADTPRSAKCHPHRRSLYLCFRSVGRVH